MGETTSLEPFSWILLDKIHLKWRNKWFVKKLSDILTLRWLEKSQIGTDDYYMIILKSMNNDYLIFKNDI